MKILKALFETINKEAFKLKSVKEIYTRTLSQEELTDNQIDYISGFQVIDNNIRITILEGITGKAMNIIKEKLPKLELNSDKRKIFSNSKILFDKRIYSNFNLCLKFIKLRNPLTHILNTADIYLKANKYREIFNAFMQLGFILQSPTFESITNAKLFPSYESLSQLERKYADIINDEDLTGMYTEKKKKQKIEKNVRTTSAADSTDNNISYIRNTGNRKNSSDRNRSGSSINRKNSNDLNINVEEQDRDGKKLKRHGKLESYNLEFIKKKEIDVSKSLQLSKKDNLDRIHNFNYDFIKKLSKKKAKSNNFWTYEKLTPLENIVYSNQVTEDGSYSDSLKNEPYSFAYSNDSSKNEISPSIFSKNEENSPKEKEYYLYSQQKNNIYSNHIKELRNKYNKDKDNFLTYSMDYLTLSFPIAEEKNMRYDNYIQNKKKWICNKDFDNYKQLNKEFYFYPKVKQEF